MGDVIRSAMASTELLSGEGPFKLIAKPQSNDGSPRIDRDQFDYRAMDEAIGDRSITEVERFAKTKDDTLKFNWWSWAIDKTEESDTVLQSHIRAILMNLPTPETHFRFLHNSLKIGDDRRALSILEQLPDLFVEEWNGDCAINLAVSSGRVEVVKMFLNLVEAKGWEHFIIPATTLPAGSSPERAHQNSPGEETLLDIAAGKGHTEVVKALITFKHEVLDHGYPLHAAVRPGHIDVVKYLLSVKLELVESITPEPDPRSVLNIPCSQGKGKVDEKMDRLLVSAIIKSKGRSGSPAMIRELLKGSTDQHREVCLDLSMFGYPTHRFKPMVNRLVQEEPLPNLSFHKTLAYVAFPCLDTSDPSSYPESVGPDAERVLQWLKVSKGVSEIIRLVVPGSAPRAESEEVIGKALQGISVVSLDWRVLDLSIDTIFNSESKNVEELSLYSSGNWGVLKQWSGPEGVTILPNLKRLVIVLVKGMISEDHEKIYIRELGERLSDSLTDVEFKHEILSWQEIGPIGGPSVVQRDVLDSTLAIPYMTNFLNFYTGYQQDRETNIKVAIIDNGVDSTLPTLSKAVKAGVCLDEDFLGHQDPWWLASHPHGTQMANFIHQLDPFCHLYIAKVCDETTRVNPDKVADAIDWAKEQKVDIISISITMPTSSQRLQKAIEYAKSDDIVIFGSRGDQGNNQERVYPADYAEVISISSLTQFGKRAQSTESNASYFLQGENVRIIAEPCYLEPQRYASGSSVATALAAGVAALILACFKLGGSKAKISRIRMVRNVLEWMIDKEVRPKNYVKPWLVFMDQKMNDERGSEWLKARFGERGVYWPTDRQT